MKMNFPDVTSDSRFRNYHNKNMQSDTSSLLQRYCGFPKIKPEQMGHGGLMRHLKFLLHFGWSEANGTLNNIETIETKKSKKWLCFQSICFFFSALMERLEKAEEEQGGVHPNKHDASLDKPQTLNRISQPFHHTAAQKATAGTQHNNLLSGER